MTIAVFGTAHLFGMTGVDASVAVLDAAWDVGFQAFDTAPLYGHGRSEVELGTRLRGGVERPQVTSKVGLDAALPAAPGVRVAKALARRLPGPVRQRLRPPGDGVPRGDFDPARVRSSVDRTLHRLGRVDRLMLHEAHAEDLTDELFELLAGWCARGDVGQIGVATVNGAAGAVARRAPDVVTAAHVEVGPFAPPVDLPASVVTRVGHGALGPGGSGLRRLAAWSERDDDAARSWRSATGGTRWAGGSGLADALVARAAALPLTDVIVATSRVERLDNLRALAAGEVPLPAPVADALAGLVAAARAEPSV